ncbi:hypothetical protein CDAR_613401 [Caerostris darwini]|uniref:Uncharacterized protein n=1 Tax=Caerostris darwini TaxID=1538125 RepID=A0AAV4UMZ9_9ARAC|nr:hypothetical protein CDAR_613401 [Caerostris darwini]
MTVRIVQIVNYTGALQVPSLLSSTTSLTMNELWEVSHLVIEVRDECLHRDSRHSSGGGGWGNRNRITDIPPPLPNNMFEGRATTCNFMIRSGTSLYHRRNELYLISRETCYRTLHIIEQCSSQ